MPSPCPTHCPSRLPSPLLHTQSGQGFPGIGAEVRGRAPAQGGCCQLGSFPRIHAEFQLSEPPDFPFWFSPGQFTGHIILSKDATHVRDFRLFVPNHR